MAGPGEAAAAEAEHLDVITVTPEMVVAVGQPGRCRTCLVTQVWVDAYLRTEAGRAEVAKAAREIMG